jgi:hypothetical protein
MGAYELIFVDIPSLESNTLEAGIYPNPFSGSTTINYTLEGATSVTVTIFNNYGQMVVMPVNGWQQEGEYKVILNAENLPAGMYFYRIQAGRLSGSGKMVVVK